MKLRPFRRRMALQSDYDLIIFFFFRLSDINNSVYTHSCVLLDFLQGVEGKRVRPTVILLFSSTFAPAVPIGALQQNQAQQYNNPVTQRVSDIYSSLSNDLRGKQRRLAQIAEMIHVASLMHDDVLDNAKQRRGIMSLNNLLGNKHAILAGDFLLARASVLLASLGKHIPIILAT